MRYSSVEENKTICTNCQRECPDDARCPTYIKLCPKCKMNYIRYGEKESCEKCGSALIPTIVTLKQWRYYESALMSSAAEKAFYLTGDCEACSEIRRSYLTPTGQLEADVENEKLSPKKRGEALLLLSWKAERERHIPTAAACLSDKKMKLAAMLFLHRCDSQLTYMIGKAENVWAPLRF